MREKEFLVFIGDKRIFCYTEEDLKEYTSGLNSWEYCIYKYYEDK